MQKVARQTRALRVPETLRGLDALVRRVSRVVDDRLRRRQPVRTEKRAIAKTA